MDRTLRKSPFKDNNLVPPSPTSMLKMYGYLKEQNADLKSEVFQLIKRLIVETNPKDVSDIILQDNPLPKLFEVFEKAMRIRKILVIVLSDYSVQEKGASMLTEVERGMTWLKTMGAAPEE